MLISTENYQKIKQIIGVDVKHQQTDDGVKVSIADLFNALIQIDHADDFEVSLVMKSYRQREDKYIARFSYLDATQPITHRSVHLAEVVGETAGKALNTLFGEEIVKDDLKLFDAVLGAQRQSISLYADSVDGGLNCVMFIPDFRDVDHSTSGTIDASAGRDDFQIENQHISQIFSQLKQECEKLNLSTLNAWGKKGRPYYSFKGVDLS